MFFVDVCFVGLDKSQLNVFYFGFIDPERSNDSFENFTKFSTESKTAQLNNKRLLVSILNCTGKDYAYYSIRSSPMFQISFGPFY